MHKCFSLSTVLGLNVQQNKTMNNSLSKLLLEQRKSSGNVPDMETIKQWSLHLAKADLSLREEYLQ